MADKKISDFTAASVISAGDLIEIETAAGNSRKVKAEHAGVAQGTSFPGSPTSGDRFWRSDRQEGYYYDGTRWLTTQLYTATNLVQAVTADTISYLVTPELAGSDIWLVDIKTITYRSAAGEWDFVLRKNTDADVTTDIYTRDGNGTSSAVWLPQTDTIGALVSSSTHPFLTTLVDEISGTAAFYCQCSLRYRVVG